MLSTKELRTIAIAAACALTLLLGGCAAPDGDSFSSAAASTENQSASAQSVQSSSEAIVGSETSPSRDDQTTQDSSEAPMDTSVMYITANGNRFEVELEDNSSASALVKALKSGPITIQASDYGNFEKVGDLGMTLPTNDRQITTVPGDVILYQSDKITVYYDTNSWNFTKLGHIKNADGIKEKLGPGSVELKLSLD